MPSLNVVRSSNAEYSPNYLPVAVFLGGTAGIGLGLARALAKATNGNCHIIILGRNRSAAEAAFSSFPKPTALGAKHEFIQCDAILMKNVRAVAQEIRSRVDGKINFLITSSALFTQLAPEFTEEGIEKKLSLLFYARMVLIQELLPLLNEARKSGEDAKVYNVYGGASLGGPLDRVNIGRNPRDRSQGPTWTSLTMERLAKENPGVVFIHAWPGFVKTDLFQHGQNSPFFWLFGPFMALLGFLFGMSLEVSGDYMLYGLLQTKGDGLKFVHENGEQKPWPRKWEEGDEQFVWDHFVKATTPK